jgi:arginine/glutamate-rich protein 1
VQLEEEALARIQAAVADRHAAALQSPELQVRIEARLKEERARLEARLEAQLEDERQALLEKKRKVGEHILLCCLQSGCSMGSFLPAAEAEAVAGR